MKISKNFRIAMVAISLGLLPLVGCADKSHVSAEAQTDEMTASNTTVATSSYNDCREEYKFWMLISLAVSVIAILTSIIALIKISGLSKRSTRQRDDIEMIKYKLTHPTNQPSTISTGSSILSGNSAATISALTRRVAELERRISSFPPSKPGPNGSDKGTIPATPNGTGDSVPKPEPSKYFGMPQKMSATQAFFRSLLDSSSMADAYFTASVSGVTAEFTPMSTPAKFNDFRTSETLKLAVEIEGCAPNNANSMTIKRKGLATKNNNNWEITQKAIIEFKA